MEHKAIQKDMIAVFTKAVQVRQEDIKEISLLKKGMTNHAFLFVCAEKKYMLRVPGEGTDRLIDRKAEAEVYRLIDGRGIGDTCLYMDSASGYKITEYLEPSRVCDPQNKEDVSRCMEVLRNFHEMKLQTSHDFSIFRQISFYESLWGNRKSFYPDYEDRKRKIFSLKDYVDAHVSGRVLTHMDAVCDNFLFHKDASGKETVYLIDWEYAGMQDPHADIAMFGIYAGYDKGQMDDLIELYFQGACAKETRIKIYCYIAAGGLLWSNWCEYKQRMGVQFGDYALRQYQYAKDYHAFVCAALGEEKEKWGIL